MAIPLGHHDRMLGVLLLGGRGPASFSGPQTEIAQEVGGIISLALAHTELLENVTRGRSQLESLSHKLILVREEESRRIARELHDEIGQILAVLNLNLAAVKKGAGSEIAREAVDGCLDLVARLITKVRRLSLDLHPSLLDDFGLVTALRRHVESLADRTGLDLRFQADEGIGRLGTELETVCYRVVQEAITNALRHAEPVHLLIRLRLDAGKLELSVSDDGRGFDPEAALERSAGGESLGLLGMRERVSLVSGELSIISAPGAGAVIKASFPLIKNLGKTMCLDGEVRPAPRSGSHPGTVERAPRRVRQAPLMEEVSEPDPGDICWTDVGLSSAGARPPTAGPGWFATRRFTARRTHECLRVWFLLGDAVLRATGELE